MGLRDDDMIQVCRGDIVVGGAAAAPVGDLSLCELFSRSIGHGTRAAAADTSHLLKYGELFGNVIFPS